MIKVISSDGVEVFIQATLLTQVDELGSIMAGRLGCDLKSLQLLFDGRRLKPEKRLWEYYTIDESDYVDGIPTITFEVMLEQFGGKPVIYLFPPRSMEVHVKLSLHPEWTFSALYPVTPIVDSIDQEGWTTASWRVNAKPNGTLKDLQGGLEVSYLFWEAHTGIPSHKNRRTPSVLSSNEAFYPITPSLDYHHPEALLLSIIDMPIYLDKVFTSLGLHTEARTSFITYWLPDMLKHTYIAFRFLPQEAYENAAPLQISPAPDVITRIFLLFTGVESDDLHLWKAACDRGLAHSGDDGYWRGVIGLPEEEDGAQGKGLFRVLEWGGMEVK